MATANVTSAMLLDLQELGYCWIKVALMLSSLSVGSSVCFFMILPSFVLIILVLVLIRENIFELDY